MTQKQKTPDGLVIVDKPSGFTSHDVVAKMRGIAKTRRVGHAGTLDPMATGVLVLGVEKATKLLGHLALTEKEYLGTIRLGQNTLTDDAEGDITSSTDASKVVRDAVDAGIAKLSGDIMQVPSKVSAIKINGVRSYKRARDGEDFEIPARPVRISSFAVYDIRDAVAEDGTPVLDLVVSVVCSSGTYIRALARDLGADLGVGGHLTALRRTRVGPYRLDSARTLDQLRGGADRDADGGGRRGRVPPLERGRQAGAAADERCAAGDARGVRRGRGRRGVRSRGAVPGTGGGAEGQGEEPGGVRLEPAGVRPAPGSARLPSTVGRVGPFVWWARSAGFVVERRSRGFLCAPLHCPPSVPPPKGVSIRPRLFTRPGRRSE